jgi:type II secretory pathway component PulF
MGSFKKYSWFGLYKLDGRMGKGELMASSEQHARNQLEQDGVVIVDLVPVRASVLFNPVIITMQQRIDFFKHLASLLESGIRLAQAMVLIRATTTKKAYVGLLDQMSGLINQGFPFDQVLQSFAPPFSSFEIALSAAANVTGQLFVICQHIGDYWQRQALFVAKLKRVIMLPAVTFIIFIAVVLGILLGLVPQFEHFFTMAGARATGSVEFIFWLSLFIRSCSWYMIVLAGLIVVSIVFGIRVWWRRGNLFYYSIYGIPGFLTIARWYVYAQFFQILGLMLMHGVQLTVALTIAADMFSIAYIKESIHRIQQQVTAGITLYDACKSERFFNDSYVCSLLFIGQQSGNLALFIQRVGVLYQQRFEQFLDRILRYIQPLLLIILGLCVAFLMIALYQPLLVLTGSLGQP